MLFLRMVHGRIIIVVFVVVITVLVTSSSPVAVILIVIITDVTRSIHHRLRCRRHRIIIMLSLRHAQWHTPSIVFRHLPPNSARFGYATEGALFTSAQLSTDAVSALRKVRVLI